MKKLSLSLFQNEELIPLLLVLCAAAVLILLFFRFAPIQWKKETDGEKQPANSLFRPSRKRPVYVKSDWLAIVMITVLYGIVSFWQLGSSKFPSTTWQPTKQDQSIILELTGDTQFDSIYAIYGEGDNNSNLTQYQLGVHNLEIMGSDDAKTWIEITRLSNGSIYQYMITKGDWNYRYIRIFSVDPSDTLTEIGFKASGKDELLPVKVYQDDASTGKYPATLLIDEQDKIALHPTYMDEGYFDEIYHPRNAWEIANGEYMYASVHPLLGTCLIALSIKLFGMNPLAWRIPGVITGILLLPLFYAVMRELFGKRKYAQLGTLLFAADFMHLTTSRIATLEPFSIFWILLMFWFMIRYFYTSFYDTPLKQQLKLLLACGIAMGFGIATKWTACYSAVGLAILLFTNLISRYQECRRAKKLLTSAEPDTLSEADRAACMHLQETWPGAFRKTILWCFVFFIFIPIIIYWLAYLPTRVWRDGWSVANVWKQIEYMYHYHTTLKATHPYQSTWYQWIFDLRPIWYYGRAGANNIYNSISCFSNPLICWAGTPAVIYTIYRAIRSRSREAWIISVGYLTAFLPWVSLVKRCVFSYHYYPSSIFMIMALVFAIRDILKQDPKAKTWVRIFAIACVVLFFVFLPATAGFGTTNAYIKALEWLPTWYFG